MSFLFATCEAKDPTAPRNVPTARSSSSLLAARLLSHSSSIAFCAGTLVRNPQYRNQGSDFFTQFLPSRYPRPDRSRNCKMNPSTRFGIGVDQAAQHAVDEKTTARNRSFLRQ